ncbi:MAG: hypothetical protein O3B08_14385 [Proteobacteria bacterium]|nr:hypothetical protein [Pseudomonadota bacterium]
MRSLTAGILAIALGMSVAAPAFASAKDEALKKCEAIHDKAAHDACVAAANKMH